MGFREVADIGGDQPADRPEFGLKREAKSVFRRHVHGAGLPGVAGKLEGADVVCGECPGDAQSAEHGHAPLDSGVEGLPLLRRLAFAQIASVRLVTLATEVLSEGLSQRSICWALKPSSHLPRANGKPSPRLRE